VALADDLRVTSGKKVVESKEQSRRRAKGALKPGNKDHPASELQDDGANDLLISQAERRDRPKSRRQPSLR
jgi:hypothetical protein